MKHHWLTLVKAHALAVFLNANFNSGQSSTTSYLKSKSSLTFFSGLLNASFSLWLFIYLIILMPTALLICMENTFWNISKDNNFVESFKKSFMSYVKSGMRKKMESDLDILRNQGGHLVTKEFKANFCKIIIDHYLCKFYCFYLNLMHLTTFSPKYSPHWRLSFWVGSWNKRMKKKRLTWLQNLILKMHRGQRVWWPNFVGSSMDKHSWFYNNVFWN